MVVRCRHEIIKDILNVCLREEKNLVSVQRKANVSFPIFGEVIEFMKNRGLIVERKVHDSGRYPRRLFKTTSKGKKYLEYFRRLSSILEGEEPEKRLMEFLSGQKTASSEEVIPEKFRSVGFFWDIWTCSKVLRQLKNDFPDRKFRVRLQIIEIYD